MNVELVVFERFLSKLFNFVSRPRRILVLIPWFLAVLLWRVTSAVFHDDREDPADLWDKQRREYFAQCRMIRIRARFKVWSCILSVSVDKLTLGEEVF